MPQTLAEYPQLHLARRNEIAYVHRRGFRTLRWTYGQVAELAFRFARELEARGISKGDRVLLWGDNCAEWVGAFFGCMLRGVVAVPMDRIAAPDFAQRVMADVDAKLIVCASALTVHAAARPYLELENLSEALGQLSAEPYAPVEFSRDDTAQIVFTSGTTAEPRGVVLTHGNILASVDPIEREFPKYRRSEWLFHPIRFLELLPLSHVFGQFMGMFIPTLLGGTVHFQDSFKPTDIITAIKSERISVLVAVPRVVESLKNKLRDDLGAYIDENWDRAEKEHFLKRWWRFRKIRRRFGWKFWAIISGGAALDQNTEEFWRRLGYVVVQGYGLTETSSLISLNHPFKVGRRSIGKVLPGREMKLDPEMGEILVRGENVARQYWQGKGLKPVTGEEGWFRTGDLGSMDEEGNLYFKGRSKNVIVTPAGLKIYPEDLEQALRKQPQVRDVVVVGVAKGGNAEACAVLLLNNGDSGNLAIANANQTLADFQKIRRWFVWPDDDFPRTSTQKPKLELIRRAAEIQLNGSAATAVTATSNRAGDGTLEELVSNIAGRHVELKPGAHLENDLNLSSLDRVELMASIENRYQVDLGDREFSKVNTVADLENLLKKSVPEAKKADYPYSRWPQSWLVRWIRVLVYHCITLPYILVMARPRIIGRERLKDFHGPALIISNHVAQIDIGFLMAALPMHLCNRLGVAMQGEKLRSMRYPPKDWVFVKRWWEQLQYALIAAFFNVFSLPQRSKYRESFRFAGELADRGYSVVIFPEGRRTETGEMSPFRSGIGLLATQLNLPIIPMRIDGLFPFKIAKKHYAPPHAVQVRIGDPVRFEPTADPEEIARELQRIVAGL
ncbi:MAG TPA: AMP-binding protein [Candidatus Polarisedimenticolia bacterium]|nr:AMP-binding protein [Candidatus Polarisedimenticolia bacterium]